MRTFALSSRATTNTTARPAERGLDPTFSDLPWYRAWVRHQVRSQPRRVLLCSPDVQLADDETCDAHFLPLWDKIRDTVLLPGQKSIDDIADALVTEGIIPLKDGYEAAQSAKDLVFSVIGWQTMLYKPDFATYSAGGYSILDEMDGYQGESRVCLNQYGLSSKNRIPDFLLGFGIMLPPRNHCGMVDPEDQELFGQTKVVRAKDVDAHVLTKVCGVRVKWVDSLSCHLELDRTSGTLYVFRCPSFCVSSLQRRGGEEGQGSALHRCGLELPDAAPLGSEEDVAELLREILLSYRLVFGQHKRSRAAFRRLRPFEGIPQEEQDQSLARLCGRKRHDCPVTLIEREEYDLAGDFPHLRSRIVRLNGYASRRKPRSLRQLWLDKRDSTAWLALWSVLIFGTLSILLALIQTVFQILQYVDGTRNSGNK